MGDPMTEMDPPIVIRLATPDDAAAFAAIYAPVVEQTAISFDTKAPSAGDMAGRITEILGLYPWLAAADGEDRAIGYAYAGPHRSRLAYRWSVDLTVYLDVSARGAGIGRRLYAALIAILRAQGFHAAYGGITLPNPGSVALHESVGFDCIGVYRRVGFKLGAWRDVGWWGLSLSAGDEAPAEPTPFAEFRKNGDLAAILRNA
jgi:phosphinothricin acetyltransferase